MTEQPHKKKLIEVAIPLEAINKASAREKSIRHGHPSTLHLWWARRPLAACRAVLFAQLVDDPSSHPDRFPTHEDQEVERKRLFAIIEELVIWENSTNEDVLERARVEIRKSCGGELPPVYDPFSGGGSIPLEAQRLGLPAYGSDLNPVAVMIGKAMIEFPSKFKDVKPIHPGEKDRGFGAYKNAEGLAEDVKYYGEWMREKAFERIGDLYPQVNLPEEYGGGKATVVAWIWSRTVPSPDPVFAGVQVPIASSFLLSSKKGKEVWIEPLIDKTANIITYRIRNGGTKAEIANAKTGSKAGRGANFRCLLSDTAITPDYVKSSGSSGNMKKQLIAIIAEGNRSRIYLAPSEDHEKIAMSAAPDWKPETPLPNDKRAFWTPPYGLRTFGDLFTNRQLVALNTLSDLVHEAREKIEKDALTAGLSSDPTLLRDGGTAAKAYAEAVSIYLGFAIDRLADAGSSIATWATGGFIRFTFARQAIPMTWDFAECNFLSNSTGNFRGAIEWIFKAISEFLPRNSGSVCQQDAQNVVLPDGAVISTDPPYYDNIGYADLSDFFYVWMRRNIKLIYPELSATLAVPKAEELVAIPYRHGGRSQAESFFLHGMTEVLSGLAKQSNSGLPATIYYAFKQSEIEQEGLSSTGWATFLQAVIDSGYSIVGTWPVRTERAARTIASGTNALANSVVLVCRKKEDTAQVITRAEFIGALKRELPPAIEELQTANIAPTDMPQSAIGPGFGIFSSYKSVLESDDSPMTVKTALQIINRELDEYLSGIEGEFDADTRFTITWFEQNGLEKGDSGTAISIAQARGIAVESVKHAGIIEYAAGKVRILSRDEMEEDWSPETDTHLTHWECCQNLIRALENEGEFEAAVLMKKMGGDKADAAKDLAYRLYDICDKKGWAKEGTSYNGLIAVWSDLTAQAAMITDDQLVKTGNQMSML
jgi:putative DNA methylase